MSTKNEIANMAIAHLGIGKDVTDITSDTSAEAKTLNKFYTAAQEATLRDFDWPFATKIATLALDGSGVPTEVEDWTYAYTYPADCLKLRKIRTPHWRTDTYDTRVPYRIIYKTGTPLIYTDAVTPEAEYTLAVTTESDYPEDFALAFSYRLAMLAAPRVTGGDMGNLVQNIQSMYQFHLALARQNASNEAGTDVLPDSEFIRARG